MHLSEVGQHARIDWSLVNGGGLGLRGSGTRIGFENDLSKGQMHVLVRKGV